MSDKVSDAEVVLAELQAAAERADESRPLTWLGPHYLRDLCRRLGAALNTRSSLLGMVDWLFANCRIVYYPREVGSYPIEHSPHANKDMRYSIEARFQADTNPATGIPEQAVADAASKVKP